MFGLREILAFNEGGKMKTLYLQPLNPIPIFINKNGLIGELRFNYNSNDNYMVISFQYKNIEDKPVKLKIQVDVLDKIYTHFLSICDYSKRIVKTTMFKPDYNVWDGIQICYLNPLV